MKVKIKAFLFFLQPLDGFICKMRIYTYLSRI
jgi:hypothetical protein